MIRSEKLCEGKLSTSLLEGFTCSEAAQSDCENRTVVWFKNDMPVLGLATSPFRKMEIGKLQVRLHDIMDGSSLARAIHVPTGPLHRLHKNENENELTATCPEKAGKYEW